MSNTEQSLTPNTTTQQDLTFAGQRKINIIWEGTQAAIAVIVTLALVYTSIQQTNASELKNAFFLIVGFYFSRTNHSQIGGVGEKPSQEYQGR